MALGLVGPGGFGAGFGALGQYFSGFGNSGFNGANGIGLDGSLGSSCVPYEGLFYIVDNYVYMQATTEVLCENYTDLLTHLTNTENEEKKNEMMNMNVDEM